MSSSTALNRILNKYRKISFSERDKGDRFERLLQAYLKTDPKYAYLFKNVWLWNEFPNKLDPGGEDTGIDLVGLTVEVDYWAIQFKCFQEEATIEKPAAVVFFPLLDLLLSIFNLIEQTVDIVKGLPRLVFDKEELEK